ncbi:PucR family transcriptional regulator ligand-binding domain-containing protein [Virgibacillus sp. NKC19-3]|uniref:PucR family transcriptional regulator n=1 Tax=Virgibacillus saliphilus TaxID=2831674 RepID=UPI001C9B2D67|nr:PucR family transcriptional regulator ligand-binding domain-containing protein [Virgibacillus sp. NKC19-3]MBY7142912.1 PucR family transcriptional regulator ligand-binding domain-containing protein [Virgibacillus sp. NKC19-3]
MGITLENAMKIGGLKECRILVGGEGLSKNINNVTIMEVPDVTRWLKGKELLITSFFAKNEPSDQRRFIQQLSAINTSALAIKPYHYLGEIPAFILEEAEKFGLPIIEIPEKVSYLDILSPVMSAIFNDKALLQDDMEQAHKILREVSINGGKVNDFIEALEFLTKRTVTLESWLPFINLPNLNVEITSITEEEMRELELIKHPIRFKRKCNGEEFPCIVAPILLDGVMYGCVTSWGYRMENLQLDISILEQASVFLSLEFLRLKVKHDVEQQYKNDFIQELLFNNSMNFQDLIEKGKKYQFDNDTMYTCMLITTGHKEHKNKNVDATKISRVDYMIRQQWPDAIIGNIRDYICIIFPVHDSTKTAWKEQCNALCNYLNAYVERQFVSRMGVGLTHAGITGLRESFIQAEHALKLGSYLIRSNTITFYEDLGVYRLLGEMIGSKELTEFFSKTVGKLIAYDESHHLKLLETLEAYFKHNENLKETAHFLFIHVNTLKYRIRKIASITGYSLHDTDGKMMLYLGLKINELSI